MCRLSAESLGQVFPVCELGVVHVEWTCVCAGLENERLVVGLVHVCIHTFSGLQDEIVSGHDDSLYVCIHTFNELEGLGHEDTSWCVYTPIQDCGGNYPKFEGLDN